jgi:hypothetical protein
MDAWFRMMGDAMAGANVSQGAIRALSEAVASQQSLDLWMRQYMSPSVWSTTTPKVFQDSLESMWRLMGFVPRYRYLELLERYDILRVKLEEAEDNIKHLRDLLAMQGRIAEANDLLKTWESTLDETIKAQTAWMNAWMPSDPPAEEEEP